MKTIQEKFKPTHMSLCLMTLMFSSFSSVCFANEQISAVSKLSAITVYAQQTDQQTGSSKTIQRQSLDQMGAQNMADIVKYLPLVQAPFSVYGGGTYIDSEGTSSYNIRGLDANRIGLDLDGVDLAEASISPFMPPASMSKRGAGRDYVEPEMLQSLNIVSGQADVSSDGIGGRVSFKNKSAKDYLTNNKKGAATAKAGYNSVDQSWLASVTGAVGNDSVKALIAYAHRKGHEADGNSKTKAFDSNWDLDAVLANFYWKLNDQHELGATVDYYLKNKTTFGLDETAFSAFKSDETIQDQKKERTTISLEDTYSPQQLAYLDSLKSKVWYQTSINETRTVYDQGKYTRDFFNRYKQTSTGLKMDAVKALDHQNIKYGLIFDQKKYSSDRSDVRSQGVSPFNGTYLTDSTLNRYAVYLSDQFNFDVQQKAFSITPSLRFEHQQYRPEASGSKIQDRDFSYFAPGLTLSYQLSPENLTYLKYARGARIPSPMEMGGSYETSDGANYLVMGNSNLKKETSDGFEWGLKSKPIDGISFDVTTFYNKYSDFIDYYNHKDTIPGYFLVYRAENIADAAIWGAELSSRIELNRFFQKADGFSLSLVAGKSKGSAKDKLGNKSGLNSVQPEKGSISFAFDDPNKVYGLGLTATAVGSKKASKDVSSLQTDEEVNTYQKVAGYTVFDLSAYWNISKSAKMNLSLNNIFDKTYWNYASVGTLDATTKATLIDRSAEVGRHVTASIEYKF